MSQKSGDFTDTIYDLYHGPGRVFPGAQKLVVPQADRREPLPRGHAVQGSDKIRDVGNAGERSRLKGDCFTYGQWSLCFPERAFRNPLVLPHTSGGKAFFC